MAVSEKVTIDPEHLIGGDGTVSAALALWSSRNGPVKYNTWQSLFFKLIKDGYRDETKVEGESSASRQGRIRKLYEDIQVELHGPDHKHLALISAIKEKETRGEPLQIELATTDAGRPGMTCDAGRTGTV